VKRYVHIRIGAEHATTLVCRNRVEAARRALGLVNSFRQNGRPVHGSVRSGRWDIEGFFDPITIVISSRSTPPALPVAREVAQRKHA
jgi:hypothetical protein